MLQPAGSTTCAEVPPPQYCSQAIRGAALPPAHPGHPGAHLMLPLLRASCTKNCDCSPEYCSDCEYCNIPTSALPTLCPTYSNSYPPPVTTTTATARGVAPETRTMIMCRLTVLHMPTSIICTWAVPCANQPAIGSNRRHACTTSKAAHPTIGRQVAPLRRCTGT
jgi:hypothetical protein